MFRALSLVMALLAANVNFPAFAQKIVQVSSLDGAPGAPLQLPGFWFPARGDSGPAPAVVMLHGCAGPYAAGQSGEQPRLAQRHREYSDLLNRWGIHVLVIDSLTPRGERELCTQKEDRRRVTQNERRRDALGALQWLATQPGVDGKRLGFMGWSNGGSTVLAATNMNHPEVRQARVLPSLSITFYPGCLADLRAGYEPAAPLLLLVGDADDWTPATHCKALASRFANRQDHPVQLEAYPDAHHGFDGTGPVVHRRDVPGGAHPGQGVHVGGNPAAREASRERLQRYLLARWGVPQKWAVR